MITVLDLVISMVLRCCFFFLKRGGSMWSSVNPWSADTQEARLDICVLDMLAAGFAYKLSSLFELYLYSLLVWQSL